MIACASLGAVWSVCAPDMGTAAVADRFRQIEPKALIAVDGVHHGGKALDRSSVLPGLRAALPSVRRLVLVRTPYAASAVDADLDWADAAARDDAATAAFEPAWLPFDHPLWILHSSGTTGLPKPMVHGHGGIVVNLHVMGLHNDLGASHDPNSFGERFHWYASTGWVMWNSQLSGLLLGTTVCLYDGSPAGRKEQPDWGVLWRFAARHRVTFLGAGAAWFASGMKAGVVAADCGDLSRLRVLGSTGSPLPEDVQRWGSAQLRAAQGYPGVWRHGDWIRIGADGGCVIHGRSDATLNRQGLRMGTSEIYRAVEGLDEVLDPMVVDLEHLGRESWMPLFVVLRPGAGLDEALERRIGDAIRASLSARFVPDEIFQVAEIPRTLSGKKQELPIRKLLLGQPLEKVVDPEAMANPDSLAWFVELAPRRA